MCATKVTSDLMALVDSYALHRVANAHTLAEAYRKHIERNIHRFVKRLLDHDFAEEEELTTVVDPELLGEAMHTAFRKASDHPTAAEIHRAIDGLPSAEWAAVVTFVATAGVTRTEVL